MIAYITAWIKDIIFVVLFSSFLEILLPNSNMQKFVRVILGLFILLTILNPIIVFLESRLTADQLPAMAAQADTRKITADILSTVNNVADKREQLAYDLYARDLAKQIRATVMSIDGVANAKVLVTIEPSSPENKQAGKLKNVAIYIEPGLAKDERKIAKVTIDVAKPKSTEDQHELSAALIDKTTRTVTELYQLKSNQVEVLRMN
ncbi:MAG: stage sporulation protein [Firmicutes bacterium]|nr:stage sporulation protein [Bacillota bacterium]